MSTPPPDPQFFVTFRMIFLLTKQKGKFDLPQRATNAHLRGTFCPTPLPQRLVQSTQKRHHFFYTCTTCTKHAILTECSLLRAHFPRYRCGHALRVMMRTDAMFGGFTSRANRDSPLQRQTHKVRGRFVLRVHSSDRHELTVGEIRGQVPTGLRYIDRVSSYDKFAQNSHRFASYCFSISCGT